MVSGFIDDNIREQLEGTVSQFYLTGGSDRESIEADITGLGTLTGYTDGAEAVVADMESEWNDLSARLKKVTNEKSAFCRYWQSVQCRTGFSSGWLLKQHPCEERCGGCRYDLAAVFR